MLIKRGKTSRFMNIKKSWMYRMGSKGDRGLEGGFGDMLFLNASSKYLYLVNDAQKTTNRYIAQVFILNF